MSFAPAGNASGTATITVTVNDGQTQNNLITRTFTVTVNPVNDPPTLNTIGNLTINENAGAQNVSLSGIGSGAANENQILTITATSSNPSLIPNPTVAYTSPNSTATLALAPTLNNFGSAVVTVTVSDGQPSNNIVTRSFTVTVNAVNQPPTLNQLSNVSINENAGQQTVNLSGISSGAANENQTLTVTATSNDPSLVPNPTVSYASPNSTGTLTFAPALNAFGTATITVAVNDGQPSNNIVTRTFSVAVGPVNQWPTLDALNNMTINEDAGLQTVNLSGITSGAANENQTLAVTATSSNPSLIPNPAVNYSSPNATGSITFAPVPNANGTATITVTVNDGQAQNNITTRSFTVAVVSVNDPPTLNPISNLSINENAGQQTVNLSGISSGAANENDASTITAISSNPNVVPNPTVNYSSPNSTGTMMFAPVGNAFGIATITVTVNDGQPSNNVVVRTFTVTVAQMNQPPTLDPLNNVTIDEDAGLQTAVLSGISSGAANENQTLTATAISSNQGLIPNPTVTYTSPNATGRLTFTPVASANGTATITVTVNDGQAQNNLITRTFTVTVNAVNDPPTLDPIASRAINADAGQQNISLSGITSGSPYENQILHLSATSNNPGLIPNPNVIYTSPNITGTLIFTPSPGSAGTATITVTVNDGQAESNIVTRAFSVTVNALPTISAIPNQTIVTNTSTGPVSFVLSDLETPASNLVVWAASSSPALIPTNNIVLGGSGSNRTVRLTPLAGQSGSATITLSVSDGRATGNTNFQLIVISPTQPAPGPQIQVNGSGVVLPNVSGQSLTSGQIYTLTATPALGYEFAGWNGSWNSSLARISFLATSNLVLRANFVPSPYIPVSGTYNGLFYQDDQVRPGASGSFALVVTTRGTYSGRLQLGATRYSFSGKLNLQCQGTNYLIASLNGQLSIDFQLSSQKQPYEMIGRVTDGKWTATLVGGRAAFSAPANPAPFAGTYTVLIPGQTEDPTRPAGHGYGSLRVDTSGRIRLSGVLADGTKVTQSAVVTKNGSWPLYASLYSGSGSVISWLTFVNRQNDDLNGALSWIKPPSSIALAYRNGFTYECEAVGSKLTVVPGSKILNLTDADVQFVGGGIVPSFSNSVTFGLNNSVVNASTNTLTMTFSPTTGIFKGKVVDPFTSQPFTFGGVAFQKMNAAFGFLLDAGQSSQVNLEQ